MNLLLNHNQLDSLSVLAKYIHFQNQESISAPSLLLQVFFCLQFSNRHKTRKSAYFNEHYVTFFMSLEVY